MKKIRKIFFIITLVNILLIFNVESYSTELGNEVIEENNNDENNTNSQEPENNVVVTPPVEQPQDPIEPSEPEQTEPEQTEPEQTEPEQTVPEQTEPEQPVPETPEEPQQPDIPTVSQPNVEPEQPNSNIPPQTNESTESNGNTENTYNPIYEEEKSSNNNLQNLEITGMEIEPEFNKEITEYYLIVDLTVEELEVIATAEDDQATVNIYNNEELIEGENIIKVIVTAEDGTQKVYTIYVTKTDNAIAANANLKKLQVKGFDLYPDFKNKIYKYNLTINEMITSLEVEAEAENENATIEISGNNNLEEGNNIITITVTAEDGITKREYKINTFISAFNVEVEEENKMPAIIAIIVGLVIIVILSIYIINKKHINK